MRGLRRSALNRGGYRLGVWALLIIWTAASAAGASAAPPNPGGERIRSYTVDLRLTADDVLHVRETIDYDFGTAHRHGILDYLPVSVKYDAAHRRQFPVSNIQVSSPTGAPSQTDTTSSDDGDYEILIIGDPDGDRVSGRQTYVISYDVGGTVDSDATGQKLSWQAIGTEWKVPIDAANITLATPTTSFQASCDHGPTTGTTACLGAMSPDGVARFAVTGLAAHQPTVIMASLPLATVSASGPQLSEIWSLRTAFHRSPAIDRTTLALLVVLLGGTYLAARLLGADHRLLGLKSGPAPAALQFHPPSDVTPAEFGVLITGRSDPAHVTATIIDLAVRGYLKITHLTDSSESDWILTSIDGPSPDHLPQIEKHLYESIFDSRSEVWLSELKGSFTFTTTTFTNTLEDDVVSRGWFRLHPRRARRRWTTGANLALVVSAVAEVLLIIATHDAWLGVPPIVAAVVARLLSRWITGRTAAGRDQRLQLEGFRHYLEHGEHDKIRWEAGQDAFSHNLPYAVALGPAGSWATRFDQVVAADTELPRPTWYESTGTTEPELGLSTDSFVRTAMLSLIAPTPDPHSSSVSGSPSWSVIDTGSTGGIGDGGGAGSW